jgi:2-isopropylmalate synthase
VAYVLKNDHQLDLPRRLQIEFSSVIQAKTDAEGGEVTPEQIWASFADEYLPVPDQPWGRYRLAAHRSDASVDGKDALSVDLAVDGEQRTDEAVGNGPIDAFVGAMSQLGVDVRVLDYAEHALSSGGNAKAAAYIECAVAGQVLWGVGVDANIVTASLKAVVSAVNRATRQ